MFHIDNEEIRNHLFDGNFGLEKESLRINENGFFAHSDHPFEGDPHIVKDFCENQTEINTGVHPNASGAIDELVYHTNRIYQKLNENNELLWPFSNPPYIRDEDDIPVAIFKGENVSKSEYREYLSAKYGRYKMTFSGIHVNYSFSDELLEADYNLTDKAMTFQEYKNDLYLTLAQRMMAYGWLLVSITAASPLMDSSYLEKGIYGNTTFTGMASVRCSEMGYWNEFAPIFDYKNIYTYTNSIRKYVATGILKAPSELYYPIRLKPKGENNLEALENSGVNHIELRMFDLNPLSESGVEIKDVLFAQLMMIWLSSTPFKHFESSDQVQAIANFKNAARYDLKTVKILTPDQENFPVVDAALNVIHFMKEFYHSIDARVDDILDFELEKFTDRTNRYANKIRKDYNDDFVKKGIELARKRQYNV